VLKTDLALPAAAAAVVVTAVARVHWPAGLFVKLLPAWKSADGVAESAWQQVTAVAAAVVVTESRVAMVAAVLSNVVAARFALLAAVVLVATFLTVQLPRLLAAVGNGVAQLDWWRTAAAAAAAACRLASFAVLLCGIEDEAAAKPELVLGSLSSRAAVVVASKCRCRAHSCLPADDAAAKIAPVVFDAPLVP
jgi:hypothetical protein